EKGNIPAVHPERSRVERAVLTLCGLGYVMNSKPFLEPDSDPELTKFMETRLPTIIQDVLRRMKGVTEDHITKLRSWWTQLSPDSLDAVAGDLLNLNRADETLFSSLMNTELITDLSKVRATVLAQLGNIKKAHLSTPVLWKSYFEDD